MCHVNVRVQRDEALPARVSLIVGELVVLVTASSREEALRIGRRLVEKKLVACATVVPNVVSIFEWEGSISESSECLMVLKSHDDAYSTLEAEIKSHHSYDVPEILALSVERGSSDYLAWVRSMISVPD